MNAKVHYQIATYSGTVAVYYDDPNEENEYLIAKAKKILRRTCGELPYGYQSFKVEREESKNN